MPKNKIDWGGMTVEEIYHKKNDLFNTYEMMKKMVIEMNDRMMEIEDAFVEADIELKTNRGIE